MKKSIVITIKYGIILGIIIFFGIYIWLYNENKIENGINPKDCITNYSWDNDPNRLKLPEISENLTLIIDFKNGTRLEFKNITLTNYYTSAFDLLNECCEVRYKIYCWDQVAFYVTHINNVGIGWTYKVNGIMVNAACNLVGLDNNSIVIWEFVGS